MPKRKFKHITWRETTHQSGWIVQYEGKTWGGFHQTEEAAAQTSRRVQGLKCTTQLSTTDSPATLGRRSAFKGVSFHKQSRKYFVNDVSVGASFNTDKEAAVARANALNLQTVPTRRVTVQDLIKRMTLLRQVYMPRQGKYALPADLGSAFRHVWKSMVMFSAEPALEMISIQLKYEPWRQALLACWREVGKPGGALDVAGLKDPDLHARASRLHAVLTPTIRYMSKTQVVEVWSSNCSRTVGRHSSPQMVLHHLGLLQKGGSLAFEQGSEGSWRLASSKQEVESSVKKLMKLILGWCTVRKVIRRAPKTCTEWCKLQRSAFMALKKLKVPIPRLDVSKGHQYVLAWTLRTLMLMLMEKQGVKAARVDKKMTAWGFCSMCPDQQSYLKKMYFAIRPASVSDFLRQCGCEGMRPELFSCLVCFAGDLAWCGLGESQYDVKLWKVALTKYFRKHQVCPIPAILIKHL